VRDTHSVALTSDGEAMLGLAQGILEANERARPTAAAPLPHSTHLGHSLQVVMRAGSCYNAFACRPGLLSFDPQAAPAGPCGEMSDQHPDLLAISL
jgi:hypothetical protein